MAPFPFQVAFKLLCESTDACAVVDCDNGALLWQNAAWETLERTANPIQAPADAPRSLHQQPLLARLIQQAGQIAVGQGPLREAVSWPLPGTSMLNATAILHPFEEPSGRVTAILLQQAHSSAISSLPTETLVFDPLTGLPDRRALDQHLHLMARGKAAETLRDFAVLFIDLDGFKQINDEWGHLVGDEVLATVAHRLATEIRDGDLIVRFGGDEFVVLAHGVASQRNLAPLLSRLREAAEEPIELTTHCVRLSASIGTALVSEGHQTLRELLTAADKRMYAQKRVIR